MLQNLSKDIRECYLHADASGSLKPPVLRLQKGIILRWSVVGYRWPTATNLQNGYRISPCPSASTNIKNEPLRRKPSTPIALRQGARVIEDSRRLRVP